MRSEEKVIEIKNLNKVFRLSGFDDGAKNFFAIHDLSLDIFKGDFVAIIGSNGSGKSTLLKILSGILKPSGGSVKIFGTVSCVLELGTNLHPDLSGMDNTLLQLKINGVKKKDAEGAILRIKHLADIGDYFYQPVKFYSSGMFLRLGFALSTQVNSDVLLFDEVLSVGDEEFRLKCHAHLKKIIAEKKTILFVTHNPIEAVSLCKTCIWLKDGKVEQSGSVLPVVENYLEWQRMKYVSKKDNSIAPDAVREGAATPAGNRKDGFHREWQDGSGPGNEILTLSSIAISHEKGFDALYTDGDITIEIYFKKHSREISLSLLLAVEDQLGQPVFLSHNLNNINRENHEGIFKHDTGLFRVSCTVPANFLAAGKYKLSIFIGKNASVHSPYTEEAFRYDEDIYFSLHYRPGTSDFIGATINGAVRPAFKWQYVKI